MKIDLSQYEPVIGLEIHIQLKTSSKLFCRCSTVSSIDSDTPANTQICPICTGQPGTLPQAINKNAVTLALRLAKALESETFDESLFDRKNYFYPDLPKGYQLSQFFQPIALGGRLRILADGEFKDIAIRRLHIEEDAGKTKSVGKSMLVDMNRCGTPLVELVTEPVIHSAEEAIAVLEEIRRIVRYLGVSHGNMEQGNLRCDINISSRKANTSSFNTRVEVKNVNSFEKVGKVIERLFRSLSMKLATDKPIDQVTLGFTDNEEFVLLRSVKEDATGYRYFAEPDLLSIQLTEDIHCEAEKALTKLPIPQLESWVENYDISVTRDLLSLLETREYVEFVDKAIKLQTHYDANDTFRFIQNEIAPLWESSESISSFPLKVEHLVRLMEREYNQELSRTMTRDLLTQIIENPDQDGLELINSYESLTNDQDVILSIIKEAIENDNEVVESYCSGNTKAANKLIGSVMRALQGQADAKQVKTLIESYLQSICNNS